MGNFFKNLRPCELGTTAYVPASPVRATRGPWLKLIDITVDDADAAPLVVSVHGEYSAQNGVQSMGFPLVGYLLWGVGGAHNEVEFDIPGGRIPAMLQAEGALTIPPERWPMDNFTQGVQIHISASHVSLLVRNDGNMCALANPAGNDWIGNPTGVAKVQAFVGPGDTTRQNTLERTIFLCGGGNNT